MKIPDEHKLEHFVDRHRVLTEFDNMLSTGARRIMCLQGPGGIGKSLLIKRLLKECLQKGFHGIYIEWRDSSRFNYLEVMRLIRDSADPVLFHLFNDRVNYYTKPEYTLKIALEGGGIQGVEVLSQGEVKQSGVTVHVGHQIEIKDLNINMPRADRAVTPEEILIESTRAFLACLKALSAQQPTVIFLDALDKADDLTRAWVWEQLLERLKEPEIPQLSVIIAGREKMDPHPTFFECTTIFELQPFRPDDIVDYLERRGLERSQLAADLIYSHEGGIPIKVAMSVDSLLRLRSQGEGHVSAG